MIAIKNALEFINQNWTLIVAICAALFGVYLKIKAFFSQSKENQVRAAIEAVRLSLLSWVTEAELAYGGGTGAIKRSQVLKKIFEAYPILTQVLDPVELTAKLDKMIDDSLVDMRKLLENSEAFTDWVNSIMAAHDDGALPAKEMKSDG